MKLEHFHIGQTQVKCCVCNRWISEGTLDREGPSFRAYMCEFPCVNIYVARAFNIPTSQKIPNA